MTLPVADHYNIEIGPITAGHFSWLTARKYAGWVVFVDTNTRQLCLPLLEQYLTHDRVIIIEAPEGERSKNLATCQQLWTEMFTAGVGRRWCAICLGGGVLEDMSGFVASTFKRGIDFLQIPTTLLSMVDSSVGGKLGIDFHQLKNSIGVFANPIAVWIDPVFLQTLSDREVRSGYGEIIKHGLIADQKQWDELRALSGLDDVDWQAVIPASVNVKREIVLEDPFERGRRKALNFGHTIGHAIESYWLESNQRLLHGEAIAAGMVMEAWLSTRLDALTEEGLQEVADHCLTIYDHQVIPEEAFPHLLALMCQDKKNEDERINFTLLAAPGEAVINRTASPELIREAMEWYNLQALNPVYPQQQ